MEKEAFELRLEEYSKAYFLSAIYPRKKKKAERKHILELMIMLKFAFDFCKANDMIF